MIQPRLSAVQRQILASLAAAVRGGMTLWDLMQALPEARESLLQRSVLNLGDQALVRVHDWVRGDLLRREFRVELTADGQALAAELAKRRSA